MDITILKKIGLSDKEIRVYLNLLEYGAISVRGLAEITSLNRGTTYDILKKLQDQGLVSYYHHETKQKFVAEEPELLLKLIESKQEELKGIKDECKNLVPELRSLQDKGSLAPTSKYYEGKSGVRYILDDVLDSVAKAKDKEYYAFSSTKASNDIISAYPDFTKNRIKRGIKVKAISLAQGGRLSGLDERRWLGSNDDSATFILIYFGKIAFISRNSRNTPVGVIIENDLIYQTQKLIFLELWQHLKVQTDPIGRINDV